MEQGKPKKLNSKTNIRRDLHTGRVGVYNEKRDSPRTVKCLTSDDENVRTTHARIHVAQGKSLLKLIIIDELQN